MRAALTTGYMTVAMILAASGAQAQITGSGNSGMAGQVGSPSGRVGNAGQPVAAPGTRADGGIAGSPNRAGAGPSLQSIIPPSGAARTGLLGGETYERSGVAGRPRTTGAMPGVGMGGSSSYEKTLEQAGDAASGVGASPQAFGSGNAASSPTGATTGSDGDSTGAGTGRSLPSTPSASPASGNANTQGSVTPGTGG